MHNITQLINDMTKMNFNVSEDDDDDDKYVPYSERLETYLVPIVFFLILVVGVAGNGVLVVTLIRHSNMRSIPNTYILSLALGDLLVRDKTKITHCLTRKIKKCLRTQAIVISLTFKRLHC